MRFLLSAHFLFLPLTLVSASAQPISACPSTPPNIPALSIEAESGNPRAQFELGLAYSQSNQPEKLTLSIYWLEKAAEQGSANAEFRLAQAYGAGAGVAQDEKSALQWIERAADDGQAEAQSLLGLFYRDGLLVERDHKKAFEWFLRAARQGAVDSQVSIAQMYQEGDAVSQDYAQAAKWYKKAAEHVPNRGGAGVARSSLGFLYMDGHGVSRDYVGAYMYFALSNSKENMQWAAEKMSGSQIAEAQRRAKVWVQQHPEPQICAGGVGFSEAATIVN
jgi:TPR repeat protein